LREEWAWLSWTVLYDSNWSYNFKAKKLCTLTSHSELNVTWLQKTSF
jgi:hypothetical protein